MPPVPPMPAGPAAAALSPADDDPTADASNVGNDDGMADDAAPQGQVIATIMKNEDGTYQLISGDEPEGATPDSPSGQSFDSLGALLKGVLEVVKTSEMAQDGGDADEQFKAGFDEGTPAPAAVQAGGANGQGV